MPESTVVVIGAGASGLSAAAALTRRGIDAVVLEQDRAVGGTWGRRYDRLHLHTVRRFSGLAHFPIPSRYPTYLSRDDVVAYLNEYAHHFGLRVVTGATVKRIQPRHAPHHEWAVETVDGGAWHGRAAVIATGQYRQPIVPPLPTARGSHSTRSSAATGFSTGLESILDAPGVVNDLGEPREVCGESTKQAGLYFVGFTYSLRGHLFEANRASRRLARNLERYLTSTAD